MAKTKISQYDAISGNNTDIDGINLAEGMAPGLVNNAIRELMSQLKDFQVGSAGDPLTVGGNLAVAGTSVFTGNSTFNGNSTFTGSAAFTENVTVGGEPLGFPAGTRMLFQQSTAPVGWTKDTTNDNKALRIVSGTAGTGGSIAFTTAFGSQNVGDTALTTAQLPSHSHTFNVNSGIQSVNHAHTFNVNTNVAGAHNHTYTTNGGGQFTGSPGPGGGDFSNATRTTNNHDGHVHNVSGGTSVNNANHVHNVAGTTAGTGSGAVHNHSLNLAVQYVDVIVATKS